MVRNEACHRQGCTQVLQRCLNPLLEFLCFPHPSHLSVPHACIFECIRHCSFFFIKKPSQQAFDDFKGNLPELKQARTQNSRGGGTPSSKDPSTRHLPEWKEAWLMGNFRFALGVCSEVDKSSLAEPKPQPRKVSFPPFCCLRISVSG